MRYDVILWDVDNTLLDFSYSEHFAISEALRGIGVEPVRELTDRYSVINDGWWKRLERGEVTKEQLLTGRFLQLFAETGIVCPDVEAFRLHFQHCLGSVYRYMDGAMEVCRALKGSILQCVVTNGVTWTQKNKLELSGIAELMDGIFISEELGATKPERAFFERVLERLPRVERSRVLIVGDSLTSDMQGGNNAGLATCWYNNRAEKRSTGIRIDHEIRKLREVLSIVQESREPAEMENSWQNHPIRK